MKDFVHKHKPKYTLTHAYRRETYSNTGWQSETLAEQADKQTGCPAMPLWTYWDYTAQLTPIPPAFGEGSQEREIEEEM